MVAAGLAESASAARRLVDAGAVRIDGVAVPAKQYDIGGSELDDRVLAAGKRKVVRVTTLKS
jgi:tyrosyl-tRNA synthetase